MIQKLEGEKRLALKDMFVSCQYDRVLIDSVLEGHFGEAHVLMDGDSIVAARLDSGAFTVIYGDPGHESIESLLRELPIFIVTPQDETWKEKFTEYFGEQAQEISFIQFSTKKLDQGNLEAIVEKLPEEYQIVTLDAALAPKAMSDLNNEYLIENFKSPQDFEERGIGFCILKDGQVVCAATSMAKSSTSIDIEIMTHKDFRRKGLATIAGAKLVLTCLEQDIEPVWLAANHESELLANKLGYERSGAYGSLYIEPSDG